LGLKPKILSFKLKNLSLNPKEIHLMLDGEREREREKERKSERGLLLPSNDDFLRYGCDVSRCGPT
jgi:hypothetical protein